MSQQYSGDTREALFVCDGGYKAGMGHVRRCVALAHSLAGIHGRRIRFALNGDTTAAEVIESEGLPVGVRGAEIGFDRWLESSIKRRTHAVILDTRSSISPEALSAIRRAGILVVTLDDASDRRLSADLVFMPPVPQLRRLDWREAVGQLYAGWDWVILGRAFAGAQMMPISRRKIDVLVTMGGSDIENLTLRVAEGLAGALPRARVRCVIGPAFRHREILAPSVEATGAAVTAAADASCMASLMRSARVAVCAFGVTAYELAACGTVGVHACHTEEDTESSGAFTSEGIALNAGLARSLDVDEVAEQIGRLLARPDRLAVKSRHARSLVDGRGAERVAAKIIETCG